MDEPMRFHPAQGRESMTSLCRESGISRKTGYEIPDCYEECGVEGLSDRARRPHRYTNQLPEPAEAAMVRPRGWAAAVQFPGSRNAGAGSIVGKARFSHSSFNGPFNRILR